MVQNDIVRKEFSGRLALACEKAGIETHGRGAYIARNLHVSTKGVSKWFNGEAMPRQDKMYELAKLLQVDLFWLQHGKETAECPTGNRSIYRLVKVTGEVMPEEDESVKLVKLSKGWLNIYVEDADCYGLRIKGDSMWPRINSGEFLLIEPGTTVRAGDEVLVKTIDGRNMIKVLAYERDGEYQFTSINQALRPVTYSHHEIASLEYIAGILKQTYFVADDKTGTA